MKRFVLSALTSLGLVACEEMIEPVLENNMPTPQFAVTAASDYVAVDLGTLGG